MQQVKAVKAWQDSEGKLHATVEGWQSAELKKLLGTTNGTGCIANKGQVMPYDTDEIFTMMATDLLKQREELLAILTMGPRARPKARKAAGTTQPKRAGRRIVTLASALASAESNGGELMNSQAPCD